MAIDQNLLIYSQAPVAIAPHSCNYNLKQLPAYVRPP